jgi:hypothetical protein
MTAIQEIQKILGVKPDNKWGPITQAALDNLLRKRVVHSVMASSFADPADVAAFKKAKAAGATDQEAFRVGDNGLGKWGTDTTLPIPMCALPPEHWQHLGNKANGAKVRVVANGKEIICELRDTMPALKNIRNGAGIDLNPEAIKQLGLKPPIMISATWNWI